MARRLFLGASLFVSSILAAPANGPSTATIIGKGDHPANTLLLTQPTPKPQQYGGPAGGEYHSPAFVPPGHSLKPGLSQQQTNGKSKLGTHGAPHLPPWLSGGPMPKGGKPWGTRSAGHSNQYKDTPNTGVTRHYDFTITEQNIAPDGYQRQGMVVNGQFPGPTIEANWGDWFEITVHNSLPDEGTSMHWHGLLQSDTPWFDGVPSVMQCPIAPGSTFTYRFRADLYGSSFYHSHYSAQYVKLMVRSALRERANHNGWRRRSKTI
jgi:FtsP/CotA-like multicopper oxidase with cupredoxin domain